MSDLTLAALLCSRLCHDLIGPIAAVKNGVELITEHSDDTALVAEAQKLIAHSAGRPCAGSNSVAWRSARRAASARPVTSARRAGWPRA